VLVLLRGASNFGADIRNLQLFRLVWSMPYMLVSTLGDTVAPGFATSVRRVTGNCAATYCWSCLLVSQNQVSEKDALMVTGETTVPNGQLILWDLREGKRLATLRPHADLLQCAAFSTDGAMLVTVGTDAQHRQQIVVWDVAALITEKSASIHTKTTALVAKQISEFPVLKIRLSPFEEFGLVSCGRENIRFWRIRKGHLPGRPVLLNEYARCV
jgi:WD40 repeat protein